MDEAARTATEGRFLNEPCILAVYSSLVLGLQYLYETAGRVSVAARRTREERHLKDVNAKGCKCREAGGYERRKVNKINNRKFVRGEQKLVNVSSPRLVHLLHPSLRSSLHAGQIIQFLSDFFAKTNKAKTMRRYTSWRGRAAWRYKERGEANRCCFF